MEPTVVKRAALCLIAIALLVGCAERRTPFEPLLQVPQKPSLLVALAGASGEMPVNPDLGGDPAFTATLPTYPDPVIVEFKVGGWVNANRTDNDPNHIQGRVDGQGYYRINGCWMQVQFLYQVGRWGPGVCSGAFKGAWVDTVLVQGAGTIKRSGRIYQEPYECNNSACWEYNGLGTYAVTPLAVPINVLTPGATQVAPKTILIPPAGYTAVFRLSSTPTTLRGINVPVRPTSWQWVPASGGYPLSNVPCMPVPPNSVQCSATIVERGMMVVTGLVNGVVQTDTVKVVGPQVKITPDQPTMKFWKRWVSPKTGELVCDRPTSQRIAVSVVGADDQPISGQIVTLSLVAHDGTAGHIHTGGKPAGTLDLTRITIGTSGIGYTIYRAAKVSGPVTISGITGSYVRGSADIQVGVFDLQEYFQTSSDTLVGGVPGKHTQNHFAKLAHIQQVQAFADWFASWWQKVRINDSSLPFGGFLDYTANWDQPHATHSEGTATDFGVKDIVTGVKYPQGVINAAMLTWEALYGSAGDETKGAQPHIHLGPGKGTVCLP